MIDRLMIEVADRTVCFRRICVVVPDHACRGGKDQRGKRYGDKTKPNCSMSRHTRHCIPELLEYTTDARTNDPVTF